MEISYDDLLMARKALTLWALEYWSQEKNEEINERHGKAILTARKAVTDIIDEYIDEYTGKAPNGIMFEIKLKGKERR